MTTSTIGDGGSAATPRAQAPPAGLPPMPAEIVVAPKRPKIDWRRVTWILLGIGIFVVFYFLPGLPDAVDPGGKVFKLSWQGKLAAGLFLMAGTWWVTEVMPIGVTAIAIGLVQVLFNIRPTHDALSDFMDPSVWFIFGSIVIGLAFSRSGLTKRMAYKMLTLVGERTSMILLGSFVVTALMTHIMAHTAVAAAVFPLLLAINGLYDDSGKPTRFGKGLFMGMAWVAGAGSIITFLGSARGVAAAGMYKEFTGSDIGFFELPKYLGPLGWIMVFLIWVVIIVFLRPERATIPGLRDKAKVLARELGPMSGKEKFVILTVLTIVALFVFKSFLPALSPARPRGHHADRHRCVLHDPDPHRRGPRVDPLEHHPAVRRRHVDRLLPLEDRRGRVGRRALADDVPHRPLAGLRPRHRLLRPGDDELHHERRGHRHRAAGRARHRTLPRGRPGGDPLRRAS